MGFKKPNDLGDRMRLFRMAALVLLFCFCTNAFAAFRAEVDLNLPSDEVKHFVFQDEDGIKSIDAGLKGYNCLRRFESAGSKSARKFSITCQESGRKKAPMFSVSIICGIGFTPAGFTFGKTLEYGFALVCRGDPEN